MSGTGPVRRVVIAGGGTAGWIAAAALVKHLGSVIDVTLVESDAIGTVGVGESTIPTTRGFHQFLGIREAPFMAATQATFKLGIMFEDWLRAGERYFHAFGTVGRAQPVADFQHYWLEAHERGLAGGYGDYSPEHEAALAERFATGDDAPLAYAYHLDATAYARFLRGLSEPAGVRRVEGIIAQVERDGVGGTITALVLASGERVAGDLFLDCTGFRALLIGEALGVGYDDWSHWLPTDSAVAVQSEATAPPVPYTRAIAHRAGWRWRIPLQRRVGNGLVYAREAMSDDEANALLLDAIDGEPLTAPRVIRFATGCRQRFWARNCLALGLSAGFLEPLESTSIHLIKIAVTQLIRQFPFNGANAAVIDRYNRQARAEWEHVRDFLIAHYHLTERDDSPFWRRCRTMEVPASLAERIALFLDHAIAFKDQDDLFGTDSWVQVLLGQGVRPLDHHPAARAVPPGELRDALAALKAGVGRTVSSLPPHAEFVSRYAPAER